MTPEYENLKLMEFSYFQKKQDGHLKDYQLSLGIDSDNKYVVICQWGLLCSESPTEKRYEGFDLQKAKLVMASHEKYRLNMGYTLIFRRVY